MKFKNRKLKFEDGEPRNIVSLSMPADFIIYAPPLQAEAEAEAAATTVANSSTKSSSSIARQTKPSPGFESSMALTIFVLLTALFFMGFFSVYLRCVASGRRSRRSNFISNSRLQQLAAAASSLSSNNPSKDDQGLDPITIGSLPILPYNCNYIMSSSSTSTSTSNGGGDVDVNGDRVVVVVVDDDKDDCVVCLCEYEEGEMVKVIPYCGHLFHPECIDLWFISHSSCPLCRSTQLFPPSPQKKKKLQHQHQHQHQQQEEKEDDDQLGDDELKSRVVVLRRAYSFSGGCSSGSDCSSSSSLLGGDNERLVLLKRSSSCLYVK